MFYCLVQTRYTVSRWFYKDSPFPSEVAKQDSAPAVPIFKPIKLMYMYVNTSMMIAFLPCLIPFVSLPTQSMALSFSLSRGLRTDRHTTQRLTGFYSIAPVSQILSRHSLRTLRQLDVRPQRLQHHLLAAAPVLPNLLCFSSSKNARALSVHLTLKFLPFLSISCALLVQKPHGKICFLFETCVVSVYA